MARFRYSLQNVLDIKLKMESQAKQAFAAAKNALDEEEAKLFNLKKRKRHYETEAARLLAGRLDLRKIEENNEAIARMEEYILLQKLQVKDAENRLEKAREYLAEVMKERKTHETLREKAFEEFRQEENRRESKEIDELTSYTYGQKQVEEAWQKN